MFAAARAQGCLVCAGFDTLSTVTDGIHIGSAL